MRSLVLLTFDVKQISSLELFVGNLKKPKNQIICAGYVELVLQGGATRLNELSQTPAIVQSQSLSLESHSGWIPSSVNVCKLTSFLSVL